VRAIFSCVEHAAGTLTYLGDALGVDCIVLQHDGRFARTHDGDGAENTDWFGWDEPVLAPFDGTVDDVRINPVTNTPGTLGKPPASAITFLRDDGVRVVYGHVQAIDVAAGDHVHAGQPVARIGNNGVAWMPHIHVGAWRDLEPLQIRFDLRAMGAV
jgi:hypothetical protein